MTDRRKTLPSAQNLAKKALQSAAAAKAYSNQKENREAK
jgi:hypothetical protein